MLIQQLNFKLRIGVYGDPKTVQFYWKFEEAA
jgi:hypothetical protein